MSLCGGFPSKRKSTVEQLMANIQYYSIHSWIEKWSATPLSENVDS